MAYDSARGKVVLFGGDSYSNYSYVSHQDIWEWDGVTGTWTDVTPSGVKPSARSGHSMVYDSARDKVVLFGGEDYGNSFNDIWEWDGANSTWTDVTPEGDKPSARSGHAMVYDSGRGKVVLFGGEDDDNSLNDIWEWDGANSTWTDVTPEGDKPSARNDHAMAYDSIRGKVVLFGGSDSSLVQDTWEWDGVTGTWTDVTPSGDKPCARSGHAMVYDSGRGKVVLFGGKDVYNYLNDIWEWDGALGTWTDVTPTGGNPGARSQHAMIYNIARGKAVLFGGYSSPELHDTWELDPATDKTGAALFEAKFAETGTDYRIEIRSVTAIIYAGGSAYSNEGEDGSILYVWDTHPGQWRELASNVADVDNPDQLVYYTDDPDELRYLFFGYDRSLNFAITPAYPNGTGIDLSEVSVDYVEATVRYRLPAGTEYDCADGIDNDADGNTDCDDDECAGDAACAG